MDTCIALFRGINVGGKHILPMKDLARIMEEMGCRKVRTYIQSGNVVFRPGEQDRNTLAQRISRKISKIHGFAPKVLLLSADELKTAMTNTPFPTESGKTVHLFFLETPSPAPDMERIATLKAKSEDFSLHQNVFYLHAPNGIGRSKLAAKVEQCLDVPVTARNWNTVKKLLEMVREAET
ncbi:MAG: DUF1697 domain-containing protein [Desulfosarcinaceae bacterium]|jgi:uncharacterized protein (DUF1697 family)